MHQFLKFIFGERHYMFRTIPLSIIRSFSLYTQQKYMSYRFADSLQARSGWKTVWHIPSLCLQWKTPDDGQRKCLKYVEFHSKNKFEKLGHLVGFITRDPRSIFKTCSIISVLFSTKYRLFYNFIFFYSNNTHYFINDKLQFKYQPNCLSLNKQFCRKHPYKMDLC
jgi:hypothetical protein